MSYSMNDHVESHNVSMVSSETIHSSSDMLAVSIDTVKSIFDTTTCYDLMQTSSKVNNLYNDIYDFLL